MQYRAQHMRTTGQCSYNRCVLITNVNRGMDVYGSKCHSHSFDLNIIGGELSYNFISTRRVHQWIKIQKVSRFESTQQPSFA